MDRGDEHTGVVERISFAYTTLITDERRKIFVPNLVMVRNVVVNHSRGDRRKVVSIRLPVRIDASIDDACRIALEAAHEAAEELELGVLIGDLDDSTVWVEIEGFAPANADVPRIATAVRKRALAALADEGLLPVGARLIERTR
jgi:small-conductance mechanosensitive channel